MAKSPEKVSWAAMKDRCLRPRNKSYERYGGRGIVVCERWLVFENFLADMGKRPSPKHSLDRYPNKQGNYEPGNARWATFREQRENRDGNIVLTHNGMTQTLSRWADAIGIKCDTLNARIRAGWSAERTLTTPLQIHRKRQERADTPRPESESECQSG